MSLSAEQFTGRTIAVTGGCSGIGLAIVKALALQGATVYIADICMTLPPELKGQEKVHFVGGCDITSRTACQEFIHSIPGRLDGLVNSAGICPTEGKMASDEQYTNIMAVNVNGTWNIGTAAIRRMAEQERRCTPGLLPGTERTVGAGSIVNIASGGGLRGIAGMAVYSASKHAVLGLTRSWARDWPMLRINAVAPGVTDTPLIRGTADAGGEGDVGKLAAQLAVRSPQGRMAYATDVADVALFLLSGSSSFVTGQVIPINGGAD
ncbi:hypothetical protein BJX65DRAFT_309875 [Aspergillus insuetus]